MVEVRQGTLGGDGQWLRSGREHWAWILAVEVRQGAGGEEREERSERRGDEEKEDEKREEKEEDEDEEDEEEDEEEEEEDEEEATDIKSNNPHLAGGEKTTRHT